MSTYQSNYAGTGVGKRFGPLNPGGVGGEYKTFGGNREMIFEVTAGETASSSFTVPIFGNFRIETIYYEVETAFAASSTANLSVNGGAGLTTPIPLSTTGPITNVALTGLANTAVIANSTVVFSVNANAIASATGKARVYVQYKSI